MNNTEQRSNLSKLYPSHIEEKIGFDRIKDLLIERCSGKGAKEKVSQIAFSSQLKKVNNELLLTDEFLRIIQLGLGFPERSLPTIDHHMARVRPFGAWLEEDDFAEILVFLKSINDFVEFFYKDDREEQFPLLFELSSAVFSPQKLMQSIERVIDERGKVRSQASPLLFKLRNEIISEESRLRSITERILKESMQKGLVKEDSQLTIRNGRMVIPVPAENKRQIKGFIHDESGTGQTSFIEPAESLAANNRITELKNEERREVIRILTALSDELRLETENLAAGGKYLAAIDFIRAKAKLANDIDACLPVLTKDRLLSLIDAKHPLLLYAYKKEKKDVKPLSVQLDKESRILIISGPNAGGKSVAMKTMALVQYMLQCGLLVPCHPESQFYLFDQLFIEMGDEQSLDNDLSTYSSHLRDMRHFLDFSNQRTLFFIDEFGGGTEPQFGGALAAAILEQLNRQKAFGVITTHYASLKKLADEQKGFVNGAMLYDTKQLQPLYLLKVGKAGSSYALEIATKMGISEEVLNRAKNLSGKGVVRFEKSLGQLDSEKQRFIKQNQLLEEQTRKLEELQAQYKKQKEELENQRIEILKNAKREAAAVIENANRKIERTIKEIQEAKAEKKRTKELREKLGKQKEEMLKFGQAKTKQKKKTVDQPDYVIDGDIQIGDKVRIKGQEVTGEVTQLSESEAEVSFGLIKSKVKINRLQRLQAAEKVKKTKNTSKSRSTYDTTKKLSEFSTNLDIRGKRVEEVMPIIENYMDTAIMFDMKELRILHGKGTGALKDFVRNLLRDYREVKSIRDDHPDRGGAGISLVSLK
ncbi:MAG: Smr/MutS family protein [Cyclobacteriaceae bacterium]|nr:Smr/MutS family protein [Cyclobacteriaceae bacterium]MCH8515368.1 Smr/MutS family protein [Cyclobacteriaceae bacterium]